MSLVQSIISPFVKLHDMAASAMRGPTSDMIMFATVKPGKSPYEYFFVYWQHATSKSIGYNGKVYEVPVARVNFLDESATKVFQDTKNPMDLAVSLDKISMAQMGPLFAATEFNDLVNELIAFDPSKDMKLKVASPSGEKPDLCMFATIKPGVEPDDYFGVFWQHATSKSITYKGKSFKVDVTRAEFCDESKTKMYQNTKNPKEILCCLFGCDMAKMGAAMAGGDFSELVGSMLDFNPATGMQFLASPTQP